MVSDSFDQRPKEMSKIAQGAAQRLQLVGLDDEARGFHQRHAGGAGVVVQHLNGGIAQAALRRIYDPLEGEIVRELVDDAQIGQRIADFRALVGARAADDAIGDAQRHKPVFDLAHLRRDANQDRDLGERMLACSASISSPMRRASSSESQAPVIVTFSPGSSSVRSVLPRRP